MKMAQILSFVRSFKVLIILLGMVLSHASTWVWSSTRVQFPIPEIETLPNGLQVVGWVNDQLPLVDFSFVVKAGFRDDEEGKSGTAELLAGLLEHQVSSKGGSTSLGGGQSVVVEDDFFTIGLHGLASDAPSLLDLLAKLSTSQSIFSEVEVQREKERLKERWGHLEDYGDLFHSLAYQKIQASGTSYGRSHFLSLQEMNRVSAQDITRYYRKYFTPKNSILLGVGKVDLKALRTKIQNLFPEGSGEQLKRSWKSYVNRRLSFKVSTQKPVVWLIDRPESTQAQVKIGFRVPGILSKEREAWAVANAIVGASFQSRLNTQVRDRYGLTYAIHSSLNYRKELGDFRVSASVRNSHLGPLIRRTLEVLQDFKKGPILDSEVEKAKQYMEGTFFLNHSTLSAIGSRWLAGYIYGLGANHLNEAMNQIQAVTTQDVQSAILNGLDERSLTVVVLGDMKSVGKSLDESQFKVIRQVFPSDLK